MIFREAMRESDGYRARERAPDAATVVTRAKERGMLLGAFGPPTLRAVTHLDASAAQCRDAAGILAELASAPA